MSPQNKSNDKILLGIASICAAFFLFTLMQVFSKLLVGRHNVIEIVFYRNLIASIPFLIYILVQKRHDLLRVQKPIALTARVIIGNIAMVFTFAAIHELPMANATVLFFASTLIVPVAAHFFLKEYIGIHRWLAIAIGMAGVIFIAQPSAQMTMIGVVLALGAACGNAFIQIILRHLKAEHTITITLYFLAGGALMNTLFMPWFANTPNMSDIGFFLLIGLSGGLGQYCLTLAFKNAPASLLSPFNYTGLIWASGFDIFIFGIIPTWHVYAGAAIIISSYLYILHRERKKKSQ